MSAAWLKTCEVLGFMIYCFLVCRIMGEAAISGSLTSLLSSRGKHNLGDTGCPDLDPII